MKNSLRACAALAAASALAAVACRRGPAPDADRPSAPEANLEAPAPSSSVITSPLASPDTSYTNAMQADSLRRQAAEMGISRIGRGAADDSSAAEEDGPPAAPLTRRQSVARLRAYSREFAAERRALEKGQPKTVALPGGTPRLLPQADSGSPLDAGPKGPAKP